MILPGLLGSSPQSPSQPVFCGKNLNSAPSGKSATMVNTFSALLNNGRDVAGSHPVSEPTKYNASGASNSSITNVKVFKSTDGGENWNETGLNPGNTPNSMNDIYIHPNDSNILYVAASNGLYRTEDAGVNWTDLQVMSEKGINWDDINALSDAGVNWADIQVMSKANINWTDIQVLSEKGVNWEDSKSMSAKGINWSDIDAMSDAGGDW